MAKAKATAYQQEILQEAQQEVQQEVQQEPTKEKVKKTEKYTLAEAYPLMLKGRVFRFDRWDKDKVPYVAFIKRGQTKIVLATSVESNNFTIYRPAQDEAVKRGWYEITDQRSK